MTAVTTNIAREAKVPPPLATDADVATRPVGPCSICRRGILRGQRYGLTYPDGKAVHVACIATRGTEPGEPSGTQGT